MQRRARWRTGRKDTAHVSRRTERSEAGAPCFYAQPQTLRMLADGALRKTILLGSFTGAWNFGDLLQLRGALRWHAANGGDAVCAVQGLATLQTPLQIDRLKDTFGKVDWLFYSRGQSTHARRAQALGLERMSAPIAGCTVLHVYGGGFFNRLWGQGALQRIETLLGFVTPWRYIISGQQIGAEFAATLAQHCRLRQPDVIGCRDHESAALLARYGVEAQHSGDDAFEELALAVTASTGGAAATGRDPAIYLNTSDYVLADGEGTATAVAAINACLEALAAYCGRDAIPLLIRAFAEEQPGIRDTLSSIGDTRFGEFFSVSRVVDLVDMVARDQLAHCATTLRSCVLAVSTSYHVTLFLKMLGVPVYLFAFNEYYRQKKTGLGDEVISLAEFLALDRQQTIAVQDRYVGAQRATRGRWLQTLRALCAVEGVARRRRHGSSA